MKKIIMVVGVLAFAAGAYAAEFDALSAVKAGEIKASVSRSEIDIAPVLFDEATEGKEEKSSWCVAHPMAPGCPGYCKVSPMYPGCPMYCSKPGNHCQKSVAETSKNDKSSGEGLAKANCSANPGAPGCPLFCKDHHSYPGCPMYCQLNPLSPACKKEASANKLYSSACASSPNSPGCPGFCANEGMQMYPGCPRYCMSYPSSPECDK